MQRDWWGRLPKEVPRMAPELPWVLEVEPLGMEPVLAWVAMELPRSPPLLPEEPVLVLPDEVEPPP